MKRNLVLLITILAFLFCYTGCENSTDPEDNLAESGVENSLKEVDALAGNVMNSKITSAFLFMPDLPFYMPGIDFPGNAITGGEIAGESLSKVQDSSFFDFISALDTLKGTYTYTGEAWIYTSDPGDAIIFVYPYFSLNDSQQHTAEIKFYNFGISNSLFAMNIDISIDGGKQFEAVINLNGSNFLSPMQTAQLNNISITGKLINIAGQDIPFIINITDTEAFISITGAASKEITITVAGTNLLPSLDDSGSAETQVTEIKISYNETEIVITGFEQVTGDIGDVYYRGNKAGDFIINEDEQPYIKFNSGKETSIASIMVNLNTAILLLSSN